MSYVVHDRVAVTIEEREEHHVPMPSVPTFGRLTLRVNAFCAYFYESLEVQFSYEVSYEVS